MLHSVNVLYLRRLGTPTMQHILICVVTVALSHNLWMIARLVM